VLSRPSRRPHELGVSAAGVRIGRVGECRGEKAPGAVFGVAAGVGEDELDLGVAGLKPDELVGEPAAVDVLELVERRVAGFDDDGGERELGQPLQLEGERAVGEAGGEIVEALALDGGEDASVRRLDRVVAGGEASRPVCASCSVKR
jgi:hypothetical protein